MTVGLLQSLKAGWTFFKELQTIEKEAQEAKARWRKTTAQEAAALSDEELWACVTARLDDDALNIPGAGRTLYTAYLFDLEVQNGGLCQYFDNCPESVPYLEDALAALGAEPYRVLFHDVVTKQGVDVNQVGSSGTAQMVHCGEQCEQCPLDAFGSAYYDLYSKTPLEALCVRYARAHLQELF
ncbi:MAG: DMP19 family protein [Clostridiales bacterium]|nr:DMP19 family protein [Clostridiales bacterium]